MQVIKRSVLITIIYLMACEAPPLSEKLNSFDLGEPFGVVSIYKRFSAPDIRISIRNKTAILFQDDKDRSVEFALGFSTPTVAGLMICDVTYPKLFLAWRRTDKEVLSEKETHDLIKTVLFFNDIPVYSSQRIQDIICAEPEYNGTVYEEPSIRKLLKARAGTKGVLYLD